MWQEGYSSFVCGVQHDSCPLDLREALARIDADEVSHHLKQVGVAESMVLSTCNRFEVYGFGHEGADAGKFLPVRLAEMSGLQPDDVSHYTYHKDRDNMIRHGFGVAASMHSMVVGEPQILGQMKQAWQTSQQAGTTGPFIDRFAGTALRVGKRVRTETDIATESVSVAAVAIRLAEDIYGDLEGLSVLLVGVGEMTQSAAQHLKASGVREIVITNRSHEKARQMAPRFDANVAPFAELPALLARADIVLTSTGSTHYIVTEKMVRQALKARKQAPLLFVDMAIPRDVDPHAHTLENCYVYDMDSLGKMARKATEKRLNSLTDVHTIIEEETNRFMRWVQTRQQTALIKNLRKHFYEAREEVLAKHGDDPEKATRLLVNKLLHAPSEGLRNTHFSSEQVEAFNSLLLQNRKK